MISVRFQGKSFNITVIQVYALTSNAEEVEVEWFYEDLQDLLSSILCIDHWGRLSYLSLLFFGTLYSNGYIFPFLLCLLLHFFTQLFLRPPQITILPFCISFSWGWSWSLTAFCTISWTSVHSSSGTLSIRSNPSNVSHFHCITVRDLM